MDQNMQKAQRHEEKKKRIPRKTRTCKNSILKKGFKIDTESITEKGFKVKTFIGPNHAYKHDHQPKLELKESTNQM